MYQLKVVLKGEKKNKTKQKTETQFGGEKEEVVCGE